VVNSIIAPHETAPVMMTPGCGSSVFEFILLPGVIPKRGVLQLRERSLVGDPSLRLKSGSAQDDPNRKIQIEPTGGVQLN
jgi:hypothetical protein